MIEIKSTRNVASNGIKVLVYGNAGMGKTYICRTAPKPIILSAEAGLLSNRDVDLAFIEIKSIEDLIEAYQLIASEKGNEFETVCLDSISEIAEVILATEKAKEKDARKAYGTMQDRIMAIMRDFRDLPNKNVYFSAKMEKAKDADERLLYQPMMPGTKVGQQMPYIFDEVFVLQIGRTEDGKDFRYLQTVPDYQFVAKDRSGVLDPMEKPDLGYIFNKIKGVVNVG